MQGWNRKFLRIDLTKKKASIDKYEPDLAKLFLGGRGYAAKILWDEVKHDVEPYSPKNKLIFATGPLTGLPIPSSGKIVVASKSPLTGGYGDGNLGSMLAVNLRRAGFDFLIIEGKFKEPCYVNIIDNEVEILSAQDLWGLGTFESENILNKRYGKNSGIALIGQAGENLVPYSTILSQRGRSGGRTGMGAVMGSKNLKAVVIEGKGEIPISNKNSFEKISKDAYADIRSKSEYELWIRQGTMITVDWSQENSVLPSYNFKEGVFELANEINGESMERIKETQKGCPFCNMICGNVVKDLQDELVELDYENVAMLGSNIGIGDLKQVSSLNKLADDFGIDTISAGNSIGFIIECSQKGLIDEKIEWGEFQKIQELIEKIAYRDGLGNLVSQGTKFMAQKIGKNSQDWAMNIKGLEISAYDCHSTPGMALAYGTSPIGAHHKDAWIVSWEVNAGREKYTSNKVAKLIEMQRIRGGIFETLVTCRLPWVELGFELEWYEKFLKAVTGFDYKIDDLYSIADRIYTLIRSYWIREFGFWNREMDTPPDRWFNEETSIGPFKGTKLNKTSYNIMLDWYYEERGWSKNGIPKDSTLNNLGLNYVTNELKRKP